MSKKTITYIVTAVLVITGVTFFISQANQREWAGYVFTSYSDGTTVVDVVFDHESGTVAFEHPAVGTVTLQNALAASGVRYTNKDESIVFWEHQNEVTITKDGVEIFNSSGEGTSPANPQLTNVPQI